MTKVLGYVDAVHHGTTSPTTTNIIWFKTTTDDPLTWVLVDILFYDGTAWQSYLDLFFPVKPSQNGTPPSDERAVWRVMDGTNFLEYRVYNGSTWIPFLPDKLDKLAQAADSAKLEEKTLEEVIQAAVGAAIASVFTGTTYNSMEDVENDVKDLTLTVKSVINGKLFGTSDGNSIQNCTNNDQINLGIQLDSAANIPTNRPILIERNGVGKVIVYSTNGVSINGVNQNSFEIKDQFTSCYLRKKGVNDWVIMGNVE
ncbi:MAG: hypothetical protein EP346_00100 [Bacteroidetes bacterium]|nr:MAG: hypothetical protein EP346_00100 [Bacteroidota bacterium]